MVDCCNFVLPFPTLPLDGHWGGREEAEASAKGGTGFGMWIMEWTAGYYERWMGNKKNIG